MSTTIVKRPYEVVVLVHPDTTLEEQKELFRKNKATIETYKGSVHSLETWGKRNLATPIGKLKKAVFFHSTFEADSQAINEIERTMRINDKVLRFMHTRLDERVSLPKFMETFKKGLAESAAREKEREAKAAARKAAFAAARAERGDREDRGERPERGDRGDRGNKFDRE
jgi:small subunit ribosomal protein S6